MILFTRFLYSFLFTCDECICTRFVYLPRDSFRTTHRYFPMWFFLRDSLTWFFFLGLFILCMWFCFNFHLICTFPHDSLCYSIHFFFTCVSVPHFMHSKSSNLFRLCHIGHFFYTWLFSNDSLFHMWFFQKFSFSSHDWFNFFFIHFYSHDYFHRIHLFHHVIIFFPYPSFLYTCDSFRMWFFLFDSFLFTWFFYFTMWFLSLWLISAHMWFFLYDSFLSTWFFLHVILFIWFISFFFPHANLFTSDSFTRLKSFFKRGFFPLHTIPFFSHSNPSFSRVTTYSSTHIAASEMRVILHYCSNAEYDFFFISKWWELR